MKFMYKLLIIVACFIPVQASAVEKLSVSELLDRYAANQDKLKSFVARTETNITEDITKDGTEPYSKVKREIVEFRYEDDGGNFRAYYCPKRVHSAADGSLVPADRHTSYLWDGKRYIEHYRGQILDESNVFVSFAAKDMKNAFAIGYLGAGSILGFLYGDVERFDSILRQTDSISVRDELERVGSGNCYVIDAKTKHGTYTIWLDPKHGYGIAKANVHKGPKDLRWGRMLDSYKFAPYDSDTFSIRNVRFERIEDVWIPMEADFQIDSKGPNRASVIRIHHRVTELLLKPDHDALGSFVPDIENGTGVRIQEAPGVRYTWQEGMKFVVDERDGSIRYVPKEWSILVGVGKPLPNFEGIKLNLSAKQTKDMAILFCLFDMNQRPSRNCIRQLAQKAEELKEKDVAVAAVQASEVTEKTLNEWKKKSNIPFLVGAITADIEKTRFSWGVRSLPWLILTNWEQTVVAEGFGIDELDEELKKIIDTEQSTDKNEAKPNKPASQTSRSDSAKSFLDAKAILAGWESTYGSIRTMRVSYIHQLVDYQPPANNPDQPHPVKYNHVERVEDQGRRYHMRLSMTEDGFDRPESLMEHAFDGKTTREYWGGTTHGSIVLGLTGRGVEKQNHLKEYMRLFKEPTPAYLKDEYPNGVPALALTLKLGMTRGIVIVRPKLESVAGQLCHVVEVTLPGRRDHKGIPQQIKELFWMAHNKGMCLMKYQWHQYNRLESEIEVKQIAMAEMDGTAIWYPEKAYYTVDDKFGSMKYELTVTEFIPNVEVDEKTFRFDFPKGTDVFDRVRGIAGIDLPKEPPSLVGKSIPELDGIKIDIPLEDAKAKNLLVCFWDMQQRPSRNCLRQLSKRARELKTKDIVVVAVQASKIDENTLNQWVKKYNIPFTVRMTQGDAEKTRFTWGVKSLPWLILIDRKHIVRAEGFNVDELDERLGQIAGTEPVMENNESTGPKLRTVRFPMSRSVGRLYVGELRLLDPHWWMGWQDAGPARGDVKVPVDKALRLDVTKEGLKELSALAACKPDDIQVVSFSYADVDDAGLGHLERLTGLKMLVSPRVGDTGLAHISKLTSLISLTLRRGTFTDDGLKYISNLSSLQRLDLAYTEVTDVGLVHLRGLSSLRYLGLDYNKSVSDAGFVHLRSLNSLERMTLYGTNITGSGFSHLEGISSLREILLNHSAITDEGLGDIAKLKSLEKLSLFNTKISDVGIVHLQALGSLRELGLSGTSVSDAGLDYIGRLTSLESLDLPDWTTDAGLLKLKGLKGLKQLDLGGTQMTGIGLEPLKAFELLESLRLPRGVSDKDLAIIKEFTLLEELSIHNSPITDVGMGYLTALKSLRKLTLSNVEVTDVGYAKLGELSNLEDLTILANRNRQEYAIGDQGLAGVAKLKGLKILDLRAPNLTDAGFKHLGKLRSLQEMELKEIKITDAGFVHIGRLRSLRRLWLPSSDICDAGLRHLAELNSLQDLSLQFSGGNTAGLLHLKSLRSLSQLIVSGVTFTEDSLQHLKEISPGLRSVHIGTGGISEEDAKRIEQQVPNCSIIVFAPLSIRRPLPPKPIPPHALVGKALPKFVGINIDFGPSQARDRMILICFFDMEQRPSRNCLRQLSTRAQELKAKDAVFVAVHASKVNKDRLDNWVKENNIPFPVGMVQSDEEKIRFAWGVKSLPWLILIDKKYIVHAEGFTLSELSEKLKQMDGE
ncbi:MAG TPA: redoxin domain-containing protein [Sedimentisphaerales bacterium]|nr:redoxin domain-containing protein [Sedimentisphaerales bacterium]